VDYIDLMQDSIDYIERNLKSELSAYELAENAGFSLFHYYRLFQGIVGTPVLQYILRRKLCNAIYEISSGKKMIDVALSYGFETHAGFFKAFKREYHCSPTLYLKKYKVMKPYKINLKQEACIMLTDKKLKEILLINWELKEPVEVRSFYCDSSGNKSGNTWIVNDDLTIKYGTNIAGLKQHIALSKALAKAGLETAISVPTKDKNDYFIDGELYFCLTNRIQGECVKSGETYDGDYQSNARYLGEIIGQLHLILQKYDKEIICNEPNLYETIKDWAIPETKKYINLPNSFYDDYLEKFKKLYNFLPKHIIHRDPNPGNIIMKDGRLAGFIDFELTERNIRIFDLCYAATAILSESFTENDCDKLQKWGIILKNIIMGYDSVLKLSVEEKQAIPYVIYSIQMTCVAYFSSMDKYAELAKVNQKMLVWLIDNRDILTIF
jgi:AraC-like DNA-binding protein/Ser/Thr protein kinase RdoA (MazF antagonist)